METVPVCVVMADADGQIIFGNSHVEKMVCHPVLHSGDAELPRSEVGSPQASPKFATQPFRPADQMSCCDSG